jgi:hypothetical protein
MAAPVGNQFWKLRSKHGRDKLFATPELLREAAFEYFQWVDDHPWHKNEAIKGGEMAGETMRVATERPYTLTGLWLYLGASEEFWRAFKKANHLDFLGVIDEIEQIVYTQKFEGAAVGAFNANIIARDLGLRDKTETELSGKDGGPIQVEGFNYLPPIANPE